MRFLLRWAEHRGSDVQLKSGTVVQGSTQLAPYPAFAWDWYSIQQYRWKARQHINVLELTTLLNFLRLRAASGDISGLRLFHIFDSLVAASVAAKGRSSALILNRICRRISAAVLSSSCYVVSLWTISGWQHSDSTATLRPESKCVTAMVSRRPSRAVQKSHLKFAGLERNTVKRYGVAIESFFDFCFFFCSRLPKTGGELDYMLGEYVNNLFQDGSPYQWRADSLAAVRRFLPVWRGSTALARAHLHNWTRTLTVHRALPLSVDILLGMAAMSALEGAWDLCGAMLVGYFDCCELARFSHSSTAADHFVAR